MMTSKSSLGWLLIFSVFFSGCESGSQSELETQAIGQTEAGNLLPAAVAIPDQYGAQVSEEILRAGGNAVDAAVAVGFSLAVTFVDAGNIGGGGFMLIHIDDESVFLDYRETAPMAANRDMYLDFIEVHIYDEIHKKSVEKVIGPTPKSKADRVILKSVIRNADNPSVKMSPLYRQHPYTQSLLPQPPHQSRLSTHQWTGSIAVGPDVSPAAQ